MQHEFMQSSAQGSQAWDYMHRQRHVCASEPGKATWPRENASVRKGSKPDQPPHQLQRPGPQVPTHVNPHTQEHVCWGTHSPTSDVRHLPCEWQHVLAVQPLTHMWKQVCLCSLCAPKQGGLACRRLAKAFQACCKVENLNFPHGATSRGTSRSSVQPGTFPCLGLD